MIDAIKVSGIPHHAEFIDVTDGKMAVYGIHREIVFHLKLSKSARQSEFNCLMAPTFPPTI